jgi:hypothetical protein
MKQQAKWIGLAVAGTAISGCSAILGLDQFSEGAGGSGTGTTTGAGGSTSTASASATTGDATSTGSSTASSSSGTGGAPACQGSETMPCDTGLKGVCATGTKTCTAGQFSACVEDVASTPEDCKKPGDENCDGIACSDCVWSFLAGDASDQSLMSLAIDPQGNIFIAGTFAGSLKLLNVIPANSVTLNSFGGDDLFLAKLDPAGNALWAKHFGGAATQANSAITVATDKNGNVAIAGVFTGNADFGGGSLTAPVMKSNPFVATYDSNGVFKWQTQLGSSSVFGYDVTAAFDSGGDVIVGGDYDGGPLVVPLSAGGSTTLANNSNSRDIFVAKLTNASGGKAAWAKRFGEPIGTAAASTLMRALAVDSSDVIYLGGNFDGSITLTGNVASKGGLDGFVAKLDGTGVASLGLFQSGAAGNGVSAITVDSSGNILVAGTTSDVTDLGGGPFMTPATEVSYIVKYSNGGIYQWAKTFDSVLFLSASSNASDDVFLASYMYGDVDFGGGLLKFAGSNFFAADIALTKLDKTGTHLWSKSFGDADPQSPSAIATDPLTGGVVLGGDCQGGVDFGSGQLTSTSASYDVCLAKFQP